MNFYKKWLLDIYMFFVNNSMHDYMFGASAFAQEEYMGSHNENKNSQVIEGGKTITQVGGNYIRRSVFSLNLVFFLVFAIAIASTFYFDVGDINFPEKIPFIEFNPSHE